MRFAPTEEQLEFAATVRAALERSLLPRRPARRLGGRHRRAHVGTPGGDGPVPAAWNALAEMGATGAARAGEATGAWAWATTIWCCSRRRSGRAGLPGALHRHRRCGGGAAGAREQRRGSAGLAVAGARSPRVRQGRGRVRARSARGVGRALDAVVLVDGGLGAGGRGGATLDVTASSRWTGRGGCAGSSTPLPGPTSLADGELGARRRRSRSTGPRRSTAAELVGLSRRMLEHDGRLRGERRQFGVPVGSFQAIKHHLADAALAVEFAEPLVDGRRPPSSARSRAPVAASMAKLRGCRRPPQVAGRAALQCHGAIGYTVEYDLHLFLKRSWALRRQHGSDD